MQKSRLRQIEFTRNRLFLLLREGYGGWDFDDCERVSLVFGLREDVDCDEVELDGVGIGIHCDERIS